MREVKLSAWYDPRTEVRVVPQTWLHRERITEQYIEHPRSVWLVWNYIRRLGVRPVLRKLRSRFAERNRNKKVFGIGVGIVAAAPEQSKLERGSVVVFLAYNHSETAQSICVRQEFVVPAGRMDADRASCPTTMEVEAAVNELRAYLGWSPHSGLPVDAELLQRTLAGVAAGVGSSVDDRDRKRALTAEYICVRELPNVATDSDRPNAVLFGLGNYAKTVILPNIRPYVTVQRVHEIDPDQLAFFGRRLKVDLDTSPYPRPDLRFSSWFIAGFHNTHAELAVAALDQGAYAVIEKPLATTWVEYEKFVAALTRANRPRFFLCFQKRYSELHRWAVRDLQIRDGTPVDMHCIVYEIPLPKHHWYNWPNSGSRLTSNGCHWIDYFMFVNSYSSVVDYGIWRSRDTDVVVRVRLDNGASFVMSLTDKGSQRLGVRDYIELRKGGVTVKMVDASFYEAENRTRILRRRSVNPTRAYARMYRQIGNAIATGGAGDTVESLRSSELTLLLEDLR